MAATAAAVPLELPTVAPNPYEDAKDNISVHVDELSSSQSSSPTATGHDAATQEFGEEEDGDADLLISSPYTQVGHRLRLSTLDAQSVLFARALQSLDALTPEYATTAYADGLNWEIVLSRLRDLSHAAGHTWSAQSFYVVAFFSRLNAGIDRDLLGKLDEDSHEEAAISGGLLKYWFGSPSAERRNLATCVWRSHQDAIEGGKGPGHARAMRAARSFYERIDFKTMSLTVRDGAHSLTFDTIEEKAFDYSR